MKHGTRLYLIGTLVFLLAVLAWTTFADAGTEAFSEMWQWGHGEALDIEDPNALLTLPLDADTGKAGKPKDAGGGGGKLPFNFKDESWDPTDPGHQGGLYLSNPGNVKDSVYYDPKENNFFFNQNIGTMRFRNPSYMTFEEYMDYDMEKSLRNYWKQRHEAEDIQKKANSLIPKIYVSGDAFDRIFGGNTVDIRPSGAAELTFGVNTSRTENPAIAEAQRKISVFDFNQKIQLNVVGKIGDKLKTQINYDTEAAFNFQNQVKLEYTGYEDDIIKKIEAGNVSLPLTGTLITGSQALFGIKTQLQFGRANITTVLSQQNGRKQTANFEGGTQTVKFEVTADNYDVNKHYYLSQYFRDNYNRALSQLPVIQSNITVTKVEVYITNMTSAVDNTRNVVAFADLGESDRTRGNPGARPNEKWAAAGFVGAPLATDASGDFPSSRGSNNLYNTITGAAFSGLRSINTASGVLAPYRNAPFNFNLVADYEILERARKLQPTEFTFHPQLGYISLNSPLNNNEVLAVAYQYTANGRTYQVGEFSTDGITDPQCLYLKMLKATNPRVRLPMWDLMMKNVYSIGGYNITPQDFKLDILYNDLRKGINLNYLTESKLANIVLLQACNMDSFNNQQERIPDGMFDFLPNITVNPQNGRIYFTTIEPFGSDLRKKMISGQDGTPSAEDLVYIKKYVFQELYDSTKTAAQQIPNKNRFRLRGSYSGSSGNELSLNATNVPQGSVRVTSNGTALTENVDYTVDYAAGKVKIINPGLASSRSSIQVSYENQQAFTPIVRNLIGTNIEYKVNKDLVLGGTFLRLTERPLTQKVTLGDEPIANMIYGFNVNYKTEAPWLTRLIDKLPLINTKEMSTITFSGEFAHLLPGHSSAVGKEGISYIDDFEATQSVIDLRQQFNWQLASLPQGQPELFPETRFSQDVRWGMNRSKLAWYTIDPLFFQNLSTTPQHIRDNKTLQSNHLSRQILEVEVFPNRQRQLASLPNIPMLDLAFYPKERGPYNYDAIPTGISAGINSNGWLNAPSTRWGGMMRRIENNDFETANIQFIQFWLMDPFNEDYPILGNAGDLYFHVGDVSEDVMKDGRKMFENGLPTQSQPFDSTRLQRTPWGIVPVTPAVVNAFDADPASRPFQDIGLDGLNDAEERGQFQNYLTAIQGLVNPQVYQRMQNDPSADNFNYFRSAQADAAQRSILQRYKEFNGTEGNSSVDQPDGYPISSTTLPNNEDINRDNNLNYNESYFQYKVRIAKEAFTVGQNYITDVYESSVTTPDNRTRTVKWYQFKIPLVTPDKTVGEIQDFRSIRFMRVFLKGFSDSIFLRFARLELVRGDWRKYLFDLNAPGEYIADDKFNTSTFDIAAVNVEENASRVPVKYVLPPGIERIIDPTSTNLRQLNEQSLVLRVCNLADGKSKAAYRNVDLDMRMYKNLEMFVHAEAAGQDNLRTGEMRFFLRLGTDFDQNYYEYEIPLTFTQWGAADRTQIWPDANNINILLEKLLDAKLERNNKSWDITQPYRYSDPSVPGVNIIVVGNPNLSSVKTIMAGVRNPKRIGFQDASDDGLAKCGEVWINELRLTNFRQNSGWAANARLQAKLADIADVTVTGTRKTEGFGQLENKLNERLQNNQFLYEVNGTIKLQKFFPEKLNLNIPMFVGFSEGFITPMYDPLNPDVPYSQSLASIDDSKRRDDFLRATQDYTKKRSINFTNVKKDKGKNSKKAHFYDIENWALNYSYNEVFRRNINLEYATDMNHKGGIAYNFASQAKPLRPFEGIGFLKGGAFKILTETTISLLPNRFSFRTDLDRTFSETRARNVEDANLLINPFINKLFNTTRMYDMKWDLFKSLNIDYTANVAARIDEPAGRIDTTQIDPINRPGYTRRDSVIANLKRFGRTTLFHQTTNVTWNVPINKIPLFNWISANAKYTANFDWISAPPNILAQQAAGNNTPIANTITNSNQKTASASLNLVNLYNKIPFLKELNNPKPKAPKPLKTKEQLKKEKEDRAKMSPAEKAKLQAKEDSIRKAEQGPNPILANVAKVLMMVKNANASLSESRGTTLPGYLPKTTLFGLSDLNFNAATAPGLPFIFGDQSNQVFEKANRYKWLTQSDSANTLFTRTFNSTFTGKITIEPIKDFKIELNWSRNATRNNNGIMRYDPTSGTYNPISAVETGSYSISVISWSSAFDQDSPDSLISSTFRSFLNNRQTISQRIGQERGLSGDSLDAGSGLYRGYGKTQQDVLVPAFFAAYTGTNAGSVPLNFFKQMPAPNWRISYDGLAKLESVKQYFKSLTVSHSYRSTFNIASYTTNQFFQDDGRGNSVTRDLKNNFLPKNEIQVVTLSEQMAPLIGFDGTLQNSFLAKLEIKRDRNISLSMANSQITEIRSNEIVTGLGYKFKDVIPPFAKRFGWSLKSDLNLRLDVSFRRNQTVIRQVETALNQRTAGTNVVSIRFNADYTINQRLNLRIFYDRTINTPLITTTFPTSNTNSGIQLRFTIAP